MIFIKRPIFLTIVLILLLLGSLFSFYSTITGFSAIGNDNIKTQMLVINLLFVLGRIVSIVMIWKWMRKGVYLLGGILIAESILTMVLQSQKQTPFIYLTQIIGAALVIGLLYLAVKGVWQNFK